MTFDEEPDYNFIQTLFESIFDDLTKEENKRVTLFLFDWQDINNFAIMKKRSRKVKQTKIVKQFDEEFDASILTINEIVLETEDGIEQKIVKARSNNKIFEVEQVDLKPSKIRSTSTNMINILGKQKFYSSNIVPNIVARNSLTKEQRQIISSIALRDSKQSEFKAKRLIELQKLFGDKAQDLEKESSVFLKRFVQNNSKTFNFRIKG